MHPRQSQNSLHGALKLLLLLYFSKWQMSRDVNYDNIVTYNFINTKIATTKNSKK